MKLQSKISIFFIVSLLILSASIVTVGAIVISSIVYDMNSRLLSLELKNINEQWERYRKHFEDTHLEDQPAKLKQLQDEFLANIRNYHFGESGKLYVIHENGNVVFHSDFRSGEPFAMDFFEKIKNRRFGNVRYTYNAKRKIAQVDYFPEWKWFIVLSLDESEVYQLRNFYLTTVSAITFIILVLVFLVMLYASQPVINRLRRIVDAFKSVEQGHLNSRVEFDSNDEFQELADSFNTMVLSLSDSTVSIEVLKEEQKRFQDIAESSGDWIWEIDSNGDFLYSNPNIETMIGYKPASVLSRGFDEFLVDSDKNKAVKLMMTKFEEKLPFTNIELSLKSVSGDEVIVETSGVPIFNSGVFAGYRGISHNITNRKRSEEELVSLYQELQQASHLAGMSEVATGLLHNVGNILNSVNVSSELILEKTETLKVASVEKLAKLLNEHGNNLGDFFSNDDRAKKIPELINMLSKQLSTEQQEILREVQELLYNIDHIKNIIITQQQMAKGSGVKEEVSLRVLVEEALKLNESGLKKRNIEVARHYQEVPPIVTEKHKVIQILINLIRNAEFAVEESANTPKLITVKILSQDEHSIGVQVEDNGIGIPRENLSKIFSHGFTTRKSGNGYGLHISALAAKELGGNLTAKSDGHELGSVFILRLPVVN